MATVHVYAPISGQIWSLDCYCYIAPPQYNCNNYCGYGSGNNCSSQTPCAHCSISGYGSHPVDVGSASPGDNMLFWADQTVGSVVITQVNNICANESLVPWTDGVWIQMYSGSNGGGSYIGGVLYGHVQNRIANGTYNYNGFPDQPYFSLVLGQFTPDTCNCTCFAGVHTHMQATGSENSLYCGQSLVAGGGGTSLYQWTY